VNRGIAEAHRRGIVTSASLLANGAAFAGAVALARGEPGLGVGVHLNLSDGRPVLDAWTVPSLVEGQGNFHGGPAAILFRSLRGRLRLEEVEQEWDAQVRKVRDAGIQPTHLDGHKHVHMLSGLFEAALRVAQRHGIRAVRIAQEDLGLAAALADGRGGVEAAKQGLLARAMTLISMGAGEKARRAGLATADFFCGIEQTGTLQQAGVEALLWNLPEGITELMTHPGYADEALRQSRTRLREERQNELQILTSPTLRKIIATLGIRLVHYGLAAQ